MGASFSPSYACLHMGSWEEQVLRVHHTKAFESYVVAWLRNIDDIFVIWKGTKEEAEVFVTAINTNDLNLNFTVSLSQSSVTFLATEVFIQDNSIHTWLFRKPTAGNTILHASSTHPTHLINSIPYREMLRIRRVCSREMDLKNAQQLCKLRFLDRGYSEHIIESAIAKSMRKSRPELLALEPSEEDTPVRSQTKKKDTPFRFITAYNRQHAELYRILNKNWPTVLNDPVVGPTLPSKLSITYSKASSMKDRLVNTSPEVIEKTSWLQSNSGFYKCKTCKSCLHGINTKTYMDPFSQRQREITKLLTCKTEYAVYILLCPCGLKYVGSTKLAVHKRILQHLRAIENQDNAYPVARHFRDLH